MSNGWESAPKRYMQSGRETVDVMRDLCHFLKPGQGDDYFAVACAVQALKYDDRNGAKGDLEGDLEKSRWWRAMEKHVRGEGPDPREGRENFTPYKKASFLP